MERSVPSERNHPYARKRALAWCLTINNPGEQWPVERLKAYHMDHAMRYLVGQLEKGEQGTPHLQLYVYFKGQVSFSTVKSIFQEAHIERAKGNPQQNKDYCTKEEGRLEGPWEFGELPEKGKRNDLLQLKEDLDKGMEIQEISEKHFNHYLRYQRGIMSYKVLHAVERDWLMEVEVLWGPTGSGKSRRARAENPGAYWKSKNAGSSQYWCNYEGQNTIIIDEFYGWIPFDFLLRLLDSTPIQLDVKHGSVACSAKKIVFTSNDHPSDWYSTERFPWGTLNPLKRRINTIVYIATADQPSEELYLEIRREERRVERERRNLLSDKRGNFGEKR